MLTPYFDYTTLTRFEQLAILSVLFRTTQVPTNELANDFSQKLFSKCTTVSVSYLTYIISSNEFNCQLLSVTRCLRNSKIQFGIGISEIEPCHIISVIPKKLEFEVRFMEGCQKGWWKSNNAGRLQHTNFTMFHYADDTNKLRSQTKFESFRRIC